MTAAAPERAMPKPLFSAPASRAELMTIRAFLIIPFLALLAAVPLVWGWGISWVELILAGVFYVVSSLGDDGRIPPLLHPRRLQSAPAFGSHWRSRGASPRRVRS